MYIWVGNGEEQKRESSINVEEALTILTDDFINGDNCSAQTIIDLRNTVKTLLEVTKMSYQRVCLDDNNISWNSLDNTLQLALEGCMGKQKFKDVFTVTEKK